MGNLIQATRYPDMVEGCITKFQSSYWALHSDVRLTSAQRTFHENDAAAKIRALARFTQAWGIDDLYLLGIDDVGIPTCMDWHYFANTVRGPVLFTVSVFLAEKRLRIRAIRHTTDWVEIKRLGRVVDLKVPVSKSITIQLKPTKKVDREQQPDGTEGTPSYEEKE